MNRKFEDIKSYVNKARNILIIAHRNPDADTLGACISLKIWLERSQKNVTLSCIDKPLKHYLFLPYIEDFVDEFNLSDFELIFIIDAGASYMTNFHLKYKDIFKCGIPIVNIDHHASNDNFGEINVVDFEAASTTLILYRMYEYLNIEINVEMATCLLAGMYSDTGSFMHSNTTDEVLKVAGVLVNKGAKIAEITKSLFKRNSISSLKLWGKVLEKSFITPDNVVMSVIKDEDYREVGATPQQLSGVIDYLNMVPGSKFAVLINEDRKGNVKGSFRTRREGVDLSRIAAVFGGGGHPKASGFSIEGKLEEKVIYSIVSDDMSKKSLKF